MDLAIPFNSRNNYFEQSQQACKVSHWPAVESGKNWAQLNESNYLGCGFSVGADIYQLPNITVSTYAFTLDVPIKLDNRFFLRNEREIKNFIDLHPELTLFSNDAYKIIKKYFQTEKLEMELVNDSESEIIYQTLFVYILTGEQPKTALSNLEKVDKELFDNSENDSLLFNINLRFINNKI